MPNLTVFAPPRRILALSRMLALSQGSGSLLTYAALFAALPHFR
jgi:hypothetical protein